MFDTTNEIPTVITIPTIRPVVIFDFIGGDCRCVAIALQAQTSRRSAISLSMFLATEFRVPHPYRTILILRLKRGSPQVAWQGFQSGKMGKYPLIALDAGSKMW